ncbi:tautomerase family protein [Helcobacillus massiliensis]|nr:tautomerase family protein [Helcobacillus massiliensis]
MPLVNIDVLRGRSEDQLKTIIQAAHDAMVEAFDVPDRDRYVVLTQHEPFELSIQDTGLGIERTDDVVVFRYTSRQRSQAGKVRLYELLTANLKERAGIEPSDVVVSIVENGDADWSFGNGEAQFLTGALD